MSVRLLRMLLAAALCWVVSVNVEAADDPVATPDPAAIMDAQQQPMEQSGAPAASPAPEPAAAELGVPEAVVPEPPPDPSQLTFAITEFQVEGNSILPAAEITTVLDRYIGPSQRVKDVDDARATLESMYADAGYPTVLVAVPEQTIEDGVVKLTVIESRLGELSVTGNRHISTTRLLNKLPALRPGVVLHEPTVLEQLDVVNATPDRQVAPVLTVGQEPGTVNLELKVRDRLPLHGNVEWNNRGTPSTPEQRLSASVRYSDLFAREHTLALQTVQSPQDWGAVQVYSASYLVPLGAGRNVSGYVAVSDSRAVLSSFAVTRDVVIEGIPAVVTAQTGDAAIPGNATIAGLQYTFEIQDAHQLSVGLDYKHLRQSKVTFLDDPATPENEGETFELTSPLSYAPVSLIYAGSALDDEGITRWSLSFSESLSGLVPGGGRKDFGGDPEDLLGTPGQNRAGATGTFLVVKVHGTHVRQLNDGSSLSLTLGAQGASEPLISAEQMFAGGTESVRGYIENEALGDHGIRGAVEISTPYRSFRGPHPSMSGSLQGALFADGAGLQVKDPKPGQVNHYTLVGLGFGVRARLVKGLQARLDQAWALSSGPITRRGETRGHFSVLVEF